MTDEGSLEERVENVLSIVAILLAAASLIWQAVEWFRSGPRPKVGGVISCTDTGGAVLEIRLANSGRAECQVTSVQLLATNAPRRTGWDISNYVRDGSAKLPAELKPAHQLVLEIDAARLALAMQHHSALGHDWRLQMFLGDGTSRESKGTLNLVSSLDVNLKADIKHGHHVTRVESSTERRRFGRRR